jgi:hypothetical protein
MPGLPGLIVIVSPARIWLATQAMRAALAALIDTCNRPQDY